MAVKIKPIQLDENTIIYVEVTEDIDVPHHGLNPTISGDEEERGTTRGITEDFHKHISGLQNTIFTYTNYTLAAFKKVAVANINKVTLEFGVEMGGETGVPYITKGTAKTNLKIQVECTFGDRKEEKA
jgi:hypothetical protein